MKKTTVLVLMTLALVAASCGDDGGGDEHLGAVPTTVTPDEATTSTLAPALAEPVPLVIVAEIGGCFMMGPNCTTTLVMSDGSFGVFRTDPADVLAVPGNVADAEIVGQTDVAGLATAIAATDFGELKNTLGAGTCEACVDGIDTTVRFFTGDGPIELDSVEFEFDTALALFEHMEDVQSAIRGGGDLELKQRGE
ncbi:MAG: hypothetical protein GY788_10790 [bacterium]|nr:hypothetical protein [bacterium]